MDLVVLPTGETIRVTQVDDDPEGRLSVEIEQWTYGSSNVTVYPKQAPSSFQPTISQNFPGNTYPVIFETPPLGSTAQLNAVQIAVAGNLAAWGGCDVYVSTDNETWAYLDSIKSAGNTGVLSAALAAGSDPDATDTLSVNMSISNGTLASATAAEMNVFATLAAIVDASGTVELIAYETATLTAANRYNLTGLRRGVYGTPILAHAAGAAFCFIGLAGSSNIRIRSSTSPSRSTSSFRASICSGINCRT